MKQEEEWRMSKLNYDMAKKLSVSLKGLYKSIKAEEHPGNQKLLEYKYVSPSRNPDSSLRG